MDFDTKFIFSYLYLLITVVTHAEECRKLDSCSCETSQHKIDLHALSTGGNPRFSKKAGDYTYTFQPCVGLAQPCDKSNNAAVCQRTETSNFNTGEQDSASFSGDPSLNNVKLHFTGPAGGLVRKSTISLKCDSTVEGVFEFDGESPIGSGQFLFSLRTRYACTNPLPGPSKEHHGLSTGSVLLILFFVFLAVYFIGGILFLKFMRGAQGTEMIPNFEFWTDLPGLIKEGISFTLRGCKTDSSYSQI